MAKAPKTDNKEPVSPVVVPEPSPAPQGVGGAEGQATEEENPLVLRLMEEKTQLMSDHFDTVSKLTKELFDTRQNIMDLEASMAEASDNISDLEQELATKNTSIQVLSNVKESLLIEINRLKQQPSVTTDGGLPLSLGEDATAESIQAANKACKEGRMWLVQSVDEKFFRCGHEFNREGVAVELTHEQVNTIVSEPRLKMTQITAIEEAE